MQNLQIDSQRLWDSLMHTAQIGATPKGGICRLTLTDLDSRPKPENYFSHTSGIEGSDKGPILATSLLNAQLLDTIAKAAIDVQRVGPPHLRFEDIAHLSHAHELARRTLRDSIHRRFVSHDFPRRSRALCVEWPRHLARSKCLWRAGQKADTGGGVVRNRQ